MNYRLISYLLIFIHIISLPVKAERFDSINFHGCCMVRNIYCGMNYDYSPPQCSGLEAPNGETCMMDGACISAHAQTLNLIEGFYIPCQASTPDCDGNLSTLRLLSYENGGSCKRNRRSGKFECVRGSIGITPSVGNSAY